MVIDGRKCDKWLKKLFNSYDLYHQSPPPTSLGGKAVVENMVQIVSTNDGKLN